MAPNILLWNWYKMKLTFSGIAIGAEMEFVRPFFDLTGEELNLTGLRRLEALLTLGGTLEWKKSTVKPG